MEEIVKDFSEIKPRSKAVKVKQPLMPKLFSIFLVLVAIFSGGIAYFAAISGEASTDSDLVMGIFMFIFCVVALLVSAGLIFSRQYVSAGMLTIVSGIIVSFGLWYVGIPTVIVGILILRSKEKLEDALMVQLTDSDPIHIKELAEILRRTEADIEIAINTLKDAGKEVSFDLDTRLVSL